eukprot:1161293-Pyramimonas_sp.AAC.1
MANCWAWACLGSSRGGPRHSEVNQTSNSLLLAILLSDVLQQLQDHLDFISVKMCEILAWAWARALGLDLC